MRVCVCEIERERKREQCVRVVRKGVCVCVYVCVIVRQNNSETKNVNGTHRAATKKYGRNERHLTNKVNNKYSQKNHFQPDHFHQKVSEFNKKGKYRFDVCFSSE